MLVDTVNVALVEPAGTVTLAGTVATNVLLLDSATVAPPEGAAAANVTVPVDVFPPVTLVGLNDSDDRLAVLPPEAVTCRITVRVIPPWAAEIAEDWSNWLVLVDAVNVALVAPAGTVTLGGTVATAVLLLVRSTTAPPDGAAAVKTTVPVDELPPATGLGLSARLDTVTSAGPVIVSCATRSLLL